MSLLAGEPTFAAGAKSFGISGNSGHLRANDFWLLPRLVAPELIGGRFGTDVP